ncbi:MAG: YihA family ribosome biogenesis GTP-binding protein [Deltaproteobacteria bacterium]|nr:YihA family ribosome biogenesis GTP-binding protein [Deltaproteobacteria bacterium]MBN2671238.1 YihA family ribosome biogenesis GTP-binding protein [Deltaproteobacteria bacterium]
MIRIVETKLVSSTGRIDALPEPTHPEVAFAGRSNVGKSSLLNALSGRKGLFKVSSTPGRTRTIVHVETRLSSDARLYLVDLPGYGYAKVSRDAKDAWADFMHEYLESRQTLHLVVILVDVRRGPEQEELQLISFLDEVGIPVVLVATKLDRVKNSQQKAVLNKLQKDTGIRVIGTSATDKKGLDMLLATVIRYCGF